MTIKQAICRFKRWFYHITHNIGKRDCGGINLCPYCNKKFKRWQKEGK